MSKKETLFTIIFTTDDVEAIADECDIPLDIALDRAYEWSKYIAETATTLCNDQLASVISTNQP